jgi:hypothetical protein
MSRQRLTIVASLRSQSSITCVFPAVSAEVEGEPGSADARVSIEQSRQAIRAVARRILVVAHANAGALHERDDRSQNLVFAQSASREIARDPRPQARQRVAECDDLGVLRVVADGAPGGVIAVLFSAPRVRACGLDVTIRRAANPNVLPSWRDRERGNAREVLGACDAST